MTLCVRLRFCLTLVMLLGAAPLVAIAQHRPAVFDAPAHISVVDGAATLEREGRAEPATASMPLVPGDRLRTEDGRLAVLLADTSTLLLDRYTAVDLLSESLFRLVQGRVRLIVAAVSQVDSYRIDTPTAWVWIHGPGEYRVATLASADGAAAELAVLRGSAELVTARGSMSVRAGERSMVRGSETPALSEPFNSADWDAFDLWAEQQRDAGLSRFSSRYLPTPLQPYARTFDDHGSWQHEASHGYVWYPSATIGWRPYYDGRWTHIGHFGWTWIGFNPWAWPTHHYGRWGFGHHGWFWIPGGYWAPAWVYWATAPGFVGWSPLGFDDQPVVEITNITNVTTVTNVTQTVNSGYTISGSKGISVPWAAWTIVPRRALGLSAAVAELAVDRRGLPPDVRSAFAMPRVVSEQPAPAPPRPATAARSGGLRPGTGVQRAVIALPRSGALGQASSTGSVKYGPTGRPLLLDRPAQTVSVSGLAQAARSRAGSSPRPGERPARSRGLRIDTAVPRAVDRKSGFVLGKGGLSGASTRFPLDRASTIGRSVGRLSEIGLAPSARPRSQNSAAQPSGRRPSAGLRVNRGVPRAATPARSPARSRAGMVGSIQRHGTTRTRSSIRTPSSARPSGTSRGRGSRSPASLRQPRGPNRAGAALQPRGSRGMPRGFSGARSPRGAGARGIAAPRRPARARPPR